MVYVVRKREEMGEGKGGTGEKKRRDVRTLCACVVRDCVCRITCISIALE